MMISIIGLFVIVIFIFLIIFSMKVSGNKLYNLYLGIVSFVSIIAIGVNLGIVLTSVGKYFIVSDEEYLQFRESYKLENCRTPNYNAKYDSSGVEVQNTVAVTPTQEEIDKCEAKVRNEVKYSRSYDLKDMFITSGAWFIVFLGFFLFHYPKFLKVKSEE